MNQLSENYSVHSAVVIEMFKQFHIILNQIELKVAEYIDCRVTASEIVKPQPVGEQFTCMLIKIDNLAQLNDTLGRSAGDAILGDFGAIIKSISKSYGFMGWNQGGFLGLFEECTVSKAELFEEMLEKSVQEYNDKQVKIQVKYSVAYTNSTEDNNYDVRTLIRHTFAKM